MRSWSNGRVVRPQAANLVECSPQRMQRVVGAGFDRAGRHAESLRGLRYGGAAEVALEQYLPVLGRQRTDGGQYELAVDDLFCGVLDRLLGNLVGNQFRVPASRARFVDDDVPGHGKQPAALRAAGRFQYGALRQARSMVSCTTSCALTRSPPLRRTT